MLSGSGWVRDAGDNQNDQKNNSEDTMIHAAAHAVRGTMDL
jgi:hypothetical protein